MATSILAGASRQSTILVAVAALHVGAFLLVTGDRVDIRLDSPIPQPIRWLPPAPEPDRRPTPEPPKPVPYQPHTVTMPDVPLPPPTDEQVVHVNEPTAGTAGGSGPVAQDPGDYRLPTIAIRKDRLAALIDRCYPAGSRRVGEEGRAMTRMTVDADGRVAAWTITQGSGYDRLDSAVKCVVQHLQFNPGSRDGRAVRADVQLPIVFRLY